MVWIWLGMLIIAGLQVPPLVKRGEWGEFAAFLGLWVIATVYASIILGGDGYYISLSEIIRVIITAVAGLINI